VRALWTAVVAGCCGAPLCPARGDTVPVVVGSKSFTEAVILGEIAKQAIRATGVPVTHRRQIGGTRILWNALRQGEIDVYAEYTGTLREEIFANEAIASRSALTDALQAHGVRMTRPLGFNNTYAISMKEEVAERLDIRAISDLRRHPDLVLGFSNEFMDRADGWPALRERYELPHENVKGIDHDLAYRGLERGAIHVADAYSTDAEIDYYRLRVLHDDRNHFPVYEAVYLYRSDLEEWAPAAVATLHRLESAIDEKTMVRMNAAVKLERQPEARVAAGFVEKISGRDVIVHTPSRLERLVQRTVEHVALVLVALAAGIAVSIPLGIAATRRRRLGQIVLAVAGLIQTIPSLALLVFMIPLLGIGAQPAICALFLYSLLPMIRNTYTGVRDIPPDLMESAEALGLSSGARLWRIELPLASRTILAGIKTSAVIAVGYATLGALIGGQPILTGIRLDDIGLILEGAVPAAVLALAVQGLFETIERAIVPKGLRLAST